MFSHVAAHSSEDSYFPLSHNEKHNVVVSLRQHVATTKSYFHASVVLTQPQKNTGNKKVDWWVSCVLESVWKEWVIINRMIDLTALEQIKSPGMSVCG